MNYKKITHLTRELIIGYIEGSLSKSDSQIVEELINSDDSSFIQFSTLYNSYKELQNANLEKAPSSLIKNATQSLNIDVHPDRLVKESQSKRHATHAPASKVGGLGDPFDDTPASISSEPFYSKFDFFSRPGMPMYSFVSALLLVIITLSIYYSNGEKEIGSRPSIDPDFFNRFITPDMDAATYTNLEGIIVSYENDKLVVTQPFKFNRKALVFSKEGKLILSKDINKLRNEIINTNISYHDSIYVVITTMDSVVFKKVISIK